MKTQQLDNLLNLSIKYHKKHIPKVSYFSLMSPYENHISNFILLLIRNFIQNVIPILF